MNVNGQPFLSHLTVLDLTHYVAGPYCTKLMASLGAEVIKIERPGTGDPSRRLGPYKKDTFNSEASGLFLYLNTGKKSITLDFGTDTGKDVLRKLVTKVDVLVESFEPHVMNQLGLSFDVLKDLNQKLVMTSISNFGQTGPYRNYRGYDITLNALGGPMHMAGDPNREPLKLAGMQSAYVGGLFAFLATLSATYRVIKTGEGEYVDISVMEALNEIDCYGLMDWIFQKQVFMRRGNVGGMHPWGIYPCKDGYVALVAIGKFWKNLVEWTNLEALRDEKFKTMQGRVDNRNGLDAILIPWLMKRNKENLCKEGQDRSIPIGAVRSMKELFRSRQYAHRRFWVDVDHPVTGKLRYPSIPAVIKDKPVWVTHAPLLGEHNEEIFTGWLGYSRPEILKLKQSGII